MNLSYHLVNDNLNSYPNQFKDCGNKKYRYYSYIVIYRWKKKEKNLIKKNLNSKSYFDDNGHQIKPIKNDGLR